MTIRVLVVEDSLTVRKRLIEVLGADPELEIVGEAEDGKTAIELCRELRPDVVTLDMMLPVMTGLAATEYIMAYFPTPILIVSASTNRGELFRTYEALAAGAVDVLDKPTGDELGEVDGAWEGRLVSTVKLVSRIRVITHPRARLRVPAPFPSDPAPTSGASASPASAAAAPPAPGRSCRVVALGASTGGPGALVEILRAIPAPLPAPILLVLHIGERFSSAFADWLDSQSAHRVTFARGGEAVASLRGRVVMAPAGHHMIVRGGALRLTTDPERHCCRPSVDELFESIATEYGAAAIACLLTGMGRDGASGLRDIKIAGGFTIAQDEQSSIVFGMPREAILMGAADRVLPLGSIGPAIAQLVGKGSGDAR